MSETWFVKPRPNPRARVRLFCFHSAGGGASMFVPWAAYLPPEIELNAVQMPGRENRLKETAFKRLEPLLGELEEMIFPLLDRPFVIFGMSMGGLVGFSLAQHLRRLYNVEPAHLFAASRRAPQTADRLPPISHLPDGEFLHAIQERYQSIPDVIWNAQELLQLFLPLLRADFALLETHAYREEPPLTCPITALYGESDPTLDAEDMIGWRKHTLGSFSLQAVQGGHFFTTYRAAETIGLLLQNGLGAVKS